MLILNRFIYPKNYEIFENLQDIIVIQMSENNEDSNAFSIKLLDFCNKTFIDVYILEKYFRIYFFIWTKYEKKNG
jgi:hypothetical protein